MVNNMQLTCDYCGKLFERPRSIARRADRPHVHDYCCSEHSQLAQKEARRASRDVMPVEWLSGAEENDEKYLVNRIVETAREMRNHELFSPEWERLDIKHSVLLDVARDIFHIHGRLAAVENPDNPKGGDDDEKHQTRYRAAAQF